MQNVEAQKQAAEEIEAIKEKNRQTTEDQVRLEEETTKNANAEKKELDLTSQKLREKIGQAKEYYRIRANVAREVNRNSDNIAWGEDNEPIFKTDKLEALQKRYNAAKATFDDIRETIDYIAAHPDVLEELGDKGKGVFDLLDTSVIKFGLDSETTLQKFERTAQSQWSNLSDKANNYANSMEGVATRSREARDRLKELREIANSQDYANYDKLKAKLGEVQQYINANGLATEKWYQKMMRTFGTRVRSMLAGLVIGKITMYLRDIYKNVVDIDTAMTQLKIVTGASDRQMEKFLSNSTKLAKELGSTINEVLKSVETFSRLGYDLTDATELAKFSNILSKVAAVSSDEATKGLTSIIKGYGFDPSDAEHIADVLVSVGQKYAVSASELMEAYEKAGAALNASNTSFEKSAGLIAAANASIQDASVVGTALKTVSARIRKSKTDLDSLGESADDLAESWSVYANEIQALTGFDIMVEGSETQFKDIYDIFDGLSKAIEQLGDDADTTRARVAEILGGTRQSSVIASILANWQDASEAYATAMESAGVSTKAMDTYVNSIEGKIAQLKASFAELSNNILSSDLIKFGVDMLKTITGISNGVAKLVQNTVGFKAILGVIIAMLAQKAITKITPLLQTARVQLNLLKLELRSAKEEGKGLASVIGNSLKSTMSIEKVVNASITAISLLGGVISTSVSRFRQDMEEIAQQALEAAQKALQRAQNSREQIDSLDDLIAKYSELANSDNGAMDQAKSIQDQIVSAVGDQAAALDLVNGKYEEQLEILQGISDAERARSEKDAKIAVNEAARAVFMAMRTKGGNGYLGSASKHSMVSVSKVLPELEDAGIVTWRKNDWSDGSFDLFLEENFKTAEQFARQYKAVSEYRRKIMAQDSIDATHQEMLTGLDEYLKAYESEYEAYSKAVDNYKNLIQANAPSDALTGTKTSIELKTVADILDRIQDKYDAIVASMEDMNAYGYLSVKTFEDMNENNLLDYLTQTRDGFTLNANALQDYVDSLIDAYYAEANLQDLTSEGHKIGIQNLENLRTALAMLALSTDKAKSAAESQKDILNDQLDAYKELIDLRKELLKQYKEELDYKKELEKKEQKVSSLQTQLAVSQLDNSAAGRARSRQLASELQSAQEELDDFTLEHAIEVVTNELDNQYEEYKKMIEDQLAAIETKISELTQVGMSISDYLATLPERVDSKLPNDVGVVSVKGGGGNRTTNAFLMTHHSGGIVGGVAKIKETEEFAKLLKGEFVATPNMMKRFMNFTLPAMAASGGNEFNAPLISITCDSISKDSIPTFQRIVNDAVSEIKRELDGGLIRSGYRKPAKKIAI